MMSLNWIISEEDFDTVVKTLSSAYSILSDSYLTFKNINLSLTRGLFFANDHIHNVFATLSSFVKFVENAENDNFV